jgi:hypothetical protein
VISREGHVKAQDRYLPSPRELGQLPTIFASKEREQHMGASSTFRRGTHSPPRHSPLVGEATEEGSYTIRCLVCGVEGPERKDILKAKLAFDETFVADECYSPTS